jgi:hypothetical protein
MIRIHPSFDKLIVGLRTAQSKGEWDYDKLHNSQYTDIIDCYRMVCLCLKGAQE